MLGVIGTYAAFFNIDGSFPKPILAAACIAAFALTWVLITVWATLFYARHKVTIDQQEMKIVGAFTTTNIRLDLIEEVRWQKIGELSRVVLISNSGRAVIDLDNFSKHDKKQITNFVRSIIPLQKHVGWEKFASANNTTFHKEPAKWVVGTAHAVLLIVSFAIIFTSMVLLMIYPNFIALMALVIAGALAAYVTHRAIFKNVKTIKLS